ncbi:hypothetical protein LIER_33420 [Lithospermum erythrorhizon]|uniref:RING-type E3 ubiquitin transferase n=1 Tax=Lithospermum erythrorhizon TaxID=34254 RepID=A0AAV3S0S5_LITER
MDEFHIAKSLANVINRLTNTSDDYLPEEEGYFEEKNSRILLSFEEIKLAKLHAMTAELAMAKAKELHQDFPTVLKQTEFAVSIQLGKLLAPTVDPLLASLRRVEIEKEGEICGVCQEEMVVAEPAVLDVCGVARGLGCGHFFHSFCISRWLKENMCCPLCRYHTFG